MSAAEPFRRHSDERRKQDHQEQHDQLGDHERPYTLDDVFHADARDTADDVEDDAEIDRVYAGLLDDRHQDRGENQDGRRHVQGRADDDDQYHDRQHQQRLVSHEGPDKINDLGGDLRDRDEPG